MPLVGGGTAPGTLEVQGHLVVMPRPSITAGQPGERRLGRRSSAPAEKSQAPARATHVTVAVRRARCSLLGGGDGGHGQDRSRRRPGDEGGAATGDATVRQPQGLDERGDPRHGEALVDAVEAGVGRAQDAFEPPVGPAQDEHPGQDDGRGGSHEGDLGHPRPLPRTQEEHHAGGHPEGDEGVVVAAVDQVVGAGLVIGEEQGGGHEHGDAAQEEEGHGEPAGLAQPVGEAGPGPCPRRGGAELVEGEDHAHHGQAEAPGGHVPGLADGFEEEAPERHPLEDEQGEHRGQDHEAGPAVAAEAGGRGPQRPEPARARAASPGPPGHEGHPQRPGQHDQHRGGAAGEAQDRFDEVLAELVEERALGPVDAPDPAGGDDGVLEPRGQEPEGEDRSHVGGGHPGGGKAQALPHQDDHDGHRHHRREALVRHVEQHHRRGEQHPLPGRGGG